MTATFRVGVRWIPRAPKHGDGYDINHSLKAAEPRLVPWSGCAGPTMTEHFERHRQAWTPSEVAKLRQLAGKGMGLKAISKSMTRSEESIKTRAKIDKLKIAKKR